MSLLSLKCFQPFKLHFISIPIQISIRAISKAKLLLLIGLLSLLASSSTLAKKAPKKPLILQMEVSHPRNTDQISLIFKGNKVQLVTNTSSYQKGRVRLGVFHHPLNGKLTALRNSIEQYRQRLQKNPPKESLHVPHAPVLYINEQEIRHGHPYFKTLERIFYKVWETPWRCTTCAEYTKKQNAIVRILKTNKAESKKKAKGQKKKRTVFSKKALNCRNVGKNKLECIDPSFGIFEL